MQRIHTFFRLMTGVALVLWTGAAAPVSINTGLNSPIILDPVPTSLGTQKALIDAGSTGTVSLSEVSISGNDDLKDLQAPDGFILLDNSLFVQSTLLSGERVMSVRIGYERLGRAGVRKAGIRAGSLRLLRADLRRQRWQPAFQRIRAQGRATKRVRGLATLRLGDYGLDQTNQNVWAVTDIGKDQYFAIGGLAIVPLPAAWLLFLSASGALFLVTRRRNRQAA